MENSEKAVRINAVGTGTRVRACNDILSHFDWRRYHYRPWIGWSECHCKFPKIYRVKLRSCMGGFIVKLQATWSHRYTQSTKCQWCPFCCSHDWCCRTRITVWMTTAAAWIHLIESFLLWNRREKIRLIASVESALGIMNIQEIATADPRMDALIVCMTRVSFISWWWYGCSYIPNPFTTYIVCRWRLLCWFRWVDGSVDPLTSPCINHGQTNRLDSD